MSHSYEFHKARPIFWMSLVIIFFIFIPPGFNNSIIVDFRQGFTDRLSSFRLSCYDHSTIPVRESLTCKKFGAKPSGRPFPCQPPIL